MNTVEHASNLISLLTATRVLQGPDCIDDLVVLAAALEEIISAPDRIQEELASIGSVDEHQLLQVLSNLKATIIHLGSHCEEASNALISTMLRLENDSS